MSGKLGLIMALAGLVSVSARGEDAAPAAEAAASVDVVSAYIFRGGTINDEVNVQPSLTGTFFSDLTLGTWANLNTDGSQFDEIDFFASYALPLADFPIGVSLGYTEYTYPAASHEHPGGLAAGETSPGIEADREANVSFSYDLVVNEELTVVNSLTGNFGIEGPFLDKGVNITWDSAMDIATVSDVTLSGGFTAAAELGDNFANTGISYVQLNLGASFAFLNAGIHYVIETDEDVLTVDEDVWGSIGMSLPL